MESIEVQTQEVSTEAETQSARTARWLQTLLPNRVSAIAVGGGLILRWSQLGKNSLWFDEGYTAWAVSQPLLGIVRVIRADTAPPLYYLLLRLWTDLFGHTEAGLRSMSAVMSSIALLVLVAIARYMVKAPWARAIAICMFSISFMQVAYAHEARFYAMMSMLGAIDLYLVLLLCERSSVPRLLAAVVAWTASLYTNNLLGIYLACLGISWMMFPGRRSLAGRARDLAMVAVVSGLAFLPWLPALISQTHRISGGFWPSVPDRWDLARTNGIFLGCHEQSLPGGDWKWFWWIEIGVALLAAVSCRSWLHFRNMLALSVFGVLPIVLIFSYSHARQSIFMDRGFIASGVPMPLLIAVILQAALSKPARFVIAPAAMGLVYLSLMSLPDHRLGEHAEEWREACRFVQTTHATHRLVICSAPDSEPLYDYYARGQDYSARADVTGVPVSFFALQPPQTMQRLATDQDLNGIRQMLHNGDFDEVVLLSSHLWWADPQQRTIKLLSAQLRLIDRKEFPKSIVVFRFQPIR